MIDYYSRDRNEVFEQLSNPLDAVTNILLSPMNDGKVYCIGRIWGWSHGRVSDVVLCKILSDMQWFSFRSFDSSAKQATPLMLERVPMEVH